MRSSITCKSLVFKENGDPRKVLQLVTEKTSVDLSLGEVLIKILCAPINPLDINIIQGVYAVRRDLPAVGGTEASARVVKVHSSSSFSPGDLVVIDTTLNSGCWREYLVINEDKLLKLDPKIDPIDAATFMINPPTAWLMLREFVNIQNEDYVIQNSANSGVGRNVIQLAHAWNIKTINVVRDRPDIDSLKNELMTLGATHVFTEEEFAKTGKRFVNSLDGEVCLALNGVGGKSCLAIAAVLCRGGTVVTYGGMSKKAHEFSTSSIVFNDIRVRGIAVGVWTATADLTEMYKELQELMAARKVTAPPVQLKSLSDFRTAITDAMDGKHKKQMFVLADEINAKI